MSQKSNSVYRNSRYEIPELNSNLEEELKQYLSGEELEYILSKKNKATQLTALQSEEFGELKKQVRSMTFSGHCYSNLL
jgi:putative membrane protein